NRAIIDPVKNVVVEGYGLLQPRVRIGVESSTRSRLARIYSGQTGLDIYSCAISDVYQDLFGEGSFAGKGIYEVAVLQKVLDGRFPSDALLSHDLIEGAYARVGLVSDIEVVEDYPTRYAAYNKRKHRWIRGDWQVAGWLGRYVRDEKGQRVPNPISFCSRWKIADNLRRSLVEPATMLFFLFAWLAQPGIAWAWSLAALGLLFAPAVFRFAIELFSMVLSGKFDQFGYTIDAFAENVVASGLTVVFLAHQTLLSVDAIVRTIWRKIYQRKLLEWETAAQAEICGTKRTAIDRYLDWTPGFALAIAAILLVFRPASLLPAAPVLLLWAASRSISRWLNGPAHPVKESLTESDRTFVRLGAMRTWRYFAELSRAENNWLIPDNLQGEPRQVAERLSPTNLGLLFNARQVARELGFLTLPELVDLTLRTLQTVDGLPKYRGHLFNWYNTQTLSPIHPCFVSTVDSGNLLASLITLRQGCQAALDNPLLPGSLFEGVADLSVLLCEEGVVSRGDAERWRTALCGEDWYTRTDAVKQLASYWKSRQPADDSNWWDLELQKRLDAIWESITSFTPWLLPEFSNLAIQYGFAQPDRVRDLPDYIEKVVAQLKTECVAARGREEVDRLLDLCSLAKERVAGLLSELNKLDTLSGKLAEQMDFAFLVNERRKLLCIGYDFDHQLLPSACYDLLASEARTASFLAVSRGELPVDSWFRLGRTPANGSNPVVSSWTGTMFEYFMPALWMRSYPETLLEQAMVGALRRQQSHAASAGVPWGISECAHAIRDAAGNYGYQAFGEPSVAVSTDSAGDLVISPYSSFLTLSCDPEASVKNLRRMAESGWIGAYGFYEAADLRATNDGSPDDYELIHCWMAHHQGMSLLAAANLLLDGMVQNWFHRDVRVCATEMLLQEKPLPSSLFDRVIGNAFSWSQRQLKRPSRSRSIRKRSADFGWRGRTALNGSALSPEAP
ncbi:MAG: glycosyl transferase, partial [Verrucomicrobia bacterium]|nr:glycosyl transferase [Verrucomicrobiota bacterium]